MQHLVLPLPVVIPESRSDLAEISWAQAGLEASHSLQMGQCHQRFGCLVRSERCVFWWDGKHKVGSCCLINGCRWCCKLDKVFFPHPSAPLSVLDPGPEEQFSVGQNS